MATPRPEICDICGKQSHSMPCRNLVALWRNPNYQNIPYWWFCDRWSSNYMLPLYPVCLQQPHGRSSLIRFPRLYSDCIWDYGNYKRHIIVITYCNRRWPTLRLEPDAYLSGNVMAVSGPGHPRGVHLGFCFIDEVNPVSICIPLHHPQRLPADFLGRGVRGIPHSRHPC